MILVTHRRTNAGRVQAGLGIFWITPSHAKLEHSNGYQDLYQPVQAQQTTPDVPEATDNHADPFTPRYQPERLARDQGQEAQTVAAAAAQPPVSAVPQPADSERSDPPENRSVTPPRIPAPCRLPTWRAYLKVAGTADRVADDRITSATLLLS